MQMGFLSYGYAMYLTVYFVLTIRYNLPEKFIATYLESFMHFSVLGFALVSAILNVVWEFANQGIPVCWVSGYPAGCIEGKDSPYPCLRGDGYQKFGRWVIIYPTFLFFSVIFVCLAIVVWTVYRRKQMTERFMFRGTVEHNSLNNSNVAVGNVRVEFTAREQSRRSVVNRSTVGGPPNSFTEKMDTVVTQCLLYGINFTIFFFGFGFQGMLVVTNKRDLFTTWFPVLVLNAVFLPLQGLFNFLIFLRPRYNQWRQKEPLATRLWALKNALWNPSRSYRSMAASVRYANREAGARSGGSDVHSSSIPQKNTSTAEASSQMNTDLKGHPCDTQLAHENEENQEVSVAKAEVRLGETLSAGNTEG